MSIALRNITVSCGKREREREREGGGRAKKGGREMGRRTVWEMEEHPLFES